MTKSTKKEPGSPKTGSSLNDSVGLEFKRGEIYSNFPAKVGAYTEGLVAQAEIINGRKMMKEIIDMYITRWEKIGWLKKG